MYVMWRQELKLNMDTCCTENWIEKIWKNVFSTRKELGKMVVAEKMHLFTTPAGWMGCGNIVIWHGLKGM